MNFTQATSRLLISVSTARAKQHTADNSSLDAEVIGLYEQFRQPLFRYLLSFGLTPSDGEEVIQEVFLALFRHLRANKSRQNLRAWLFRVAHNLALKLRNREGGTVGLAAVMNAPGPSLDPEQEALQSQRQSRLAAVFQALPEQDRECLALRAEGFKYREISGILDISLGAVCQSLKRSVAKLAEVSSK